MTGWSNASVYIYGTGIVYWSPKIPRAEAEDTLVVESRIIRDTAHIDGSSDHSSNISPDSQVGEVSTHIVLENYILFITKLNKIFAYNTSIEAEGNQISPFELTPCYSSSNEPFQFIDLQGSYRTFAVFTSAGNVLIGHHTLLDALYDASVAGIASVDALPHPTLLPCLQQQGVISLAVGDHHVHALHDNGSVSSFGGDPRSVGAFGLGEDAIAMFRGVRKNDQNGDGKLDGTKRRTVWFEPIMQKRLHRFYADPHHNIEPEPEGPRYDESVVRVVADDALKDAYGDYFEEQGRRWESAVSSADDMGAYFAYKISAAGWHSAALVLVDEDKAEKARQRHIVQTTAMHASERSGMGSSARQRSSEQLSDPLAFIRFWTMWLIRWFLGLSARDAATEGLGNEVNRKDAASVRYIWEDQPLPHLWEEQNQSST